MSYVGESRRARTGFKRTEKQQRKIGRALTSYLVKYKNEIAKQAIEQAGRLTVQAIMTVVLPQLPVLVGVASLSLTQKQLLENAIKRIFKL